MATKENLSIFEGIKALYLYVVLSEEEEKPIDYRINCRRIKRILKINLSLSSFFQVRGCFGSCLVCANSSSFRHSSEQLGGRQNVRI
jgi:hypothetical protein